MAQYAVSTLSGGTEQVCTTTPGKTLLYAYAATGATTLRRGWIYEIEIGASGAPNSTDCTIQWTMTRATTGDGTATTLTPAPLEVNDAAALLTYKGNFTVEPTTFTGSLMYLALNQRNSQRWIAKDDVSALIIPAVNNAGIAGRAYSATYAATTGMQWYVRE